MQLSEIDLTDPDAFVSGRHHEMFAVLRRDDPVHWHEEAKGPGFWAITRHADVQTVNRDNLLFSSNTDGVNLPSLDEFADGQGDMVREMMIMMDPPRHTKYRLLVNKGFTPRMIGLLEQHLRAKAGMIVDGVCERGECDFVADVAAELPLQAIAELLGIPQEDRHRIFEWSNKMVGSDDPDFGEHEGALEASAELFAYSGELAELRRNDPDDGIVTKLLAAEVDGERLSDAEFMMFFLLLTVAGNETTRNATTHGMRALIEHPDQFERLANDLDLLPTAVDEIVRWASPIHYFRRTATADTEVGGTTIRAGDKVAMWYASANRDEAAFDDPFRFDVGRSPNDHVAFGAGGPHFCLGAHLARLELRLIFGELVGRLPDIELAGDVELLRSNFVHGVKRMPVRFTPTARVGAAAA